VENVTEAYLQAKADFSVSLSQQPLVGAETGTGTPPQSLEPQNSTLIALREQMTDLQRQVDELQGQRQERRLRQLRGAGH
jgi:hypothetical protein